MDRITRPARGATLALLLVLICGLCRPANASIVYVNKASTAASPDGKTWGTAFTTVQAAINASASGDEVWVAKGTYVENITLAAGVPLYGGFAATEATQGQRDWQKNATILDGGGSTTANVVMSSVTGSILDGFTVRRGNNGIYLAGDFMNGGMATITNCVISGNTNGIYSDTFFMWPAGSVANCTISGNTVGIDLSNTSATITSCLISRNQYGISTIGLFQPTVSCCTISGNTARGVSINVGTATISNCTITGSERGLDGNAILTNCTVSGNGYGVSPASYGGGANPTLKNSIVAFNAVGINLVDSNTSVAVSHCDVYGNATANYRNLTDPTGTNGNISQDPKLSGLFGSVHLQPGSPCIDAGDDSLVTSGETDVYGKARIIGSHVDIGSDESDGTTWPPIAPHTWYVAQTGDDANDGSSWAAAKKTVAAGLATAQPTDEVWVARGTYSEMVGITAGIALRGGFAGTETASNQRTRSGNATILDGGGSTTASVVTSSAYGAILDGFTIRNGRHGVYVNNGTTTIVDCAVGGNYYHGICLNAGAATITHCAITGNSWDGVSVSDVATITDCAIGSNKSGVSAYSGTSKVTNCSLAGNSTGITLGDGSVSVSNCVLAFNGTGIYRTSDSPLPTLSHSDVYGNTIANYTNITDPAGTDGNIGADPLLVDKANGDYRLKTGSPCIDAGDDSVVAANGTDLDGRPRITGSHVDMGAYEYRSLEPWSAALGTTVTGGVTVAERIAYVAGNDGKLYARSTETGSAVAGFPVDISAAVGATVKLPSRPAVYYGKTGKAVYLTTDRGDVVRVLPTGQVAWHVRPLTGQTVSTPAVTADGNVYVNLSTGSGPFDNFVFKLDEATGTPISLSPFLGYTTADNIGDFSPAANNRYLYVNSGWGSGSGLTLLNQDNLAVRSSFAGGEQCLSPLLLGSDLLLASKGGKAWKMNAVTLAPDLGFGHFGIANVGSPISAAPFSDGAGNVYIGTVDGRILQWTPGTLSFQPFYTATGKIAGLTIDRTAGVLGFGTSNGGFVQVPLSQPTSASTVTPGGPISTGTVYESLTDRFIVVTDDGVLSGYPAVR